MPVGIKQGTIAGPRLRNLFAGAYRGRLWQ
jgi:hypothetical protein